VINKVELKNFGPLIDIEWAKLKKINVVIGSNSCGKTFLLKALYTSIRTLEGYKRGDENKSLSELLADKLYWTFQTSKIGDLVTRGQSETLSYKCSIDEKDFEYSFGKDTTKKITAIENYIEPLKSDSVFFPAKEILSIHNIILKSFEQDKSFGFDDTYLDLARALRISLKMGKNYEVFSNSRKKLESITGGKIEYVEDTGIWQYKKGNIRYPIGVTAEGIKKIGILDTLLGNRYLTPKSVIFIDEPESALHPKAISQFLEIISDLSDKGMQFFMATHSYFVIKKLYLIAQEKNISIPILSFDDNKWTCNDLIQGMPNNPIINESINLYKKEVDLVLR
jgi:AAA15 family ATPase/GTPase